MVFCFLLLLVTYIVLMAEKIVSCKIDCLVSICLSRQPINQQEWMDPVPSVFSEFATGPRKSRSLSFPNIFIPDPTYSIQLVG